MQNGPHRVVYEPPGWVWWGVALLFLAGTQANWWLGQPAFSAFGISPAVVVLALLLPSSRDPRPTSEERLWGRYVRARPWPKGRDAAGWVRAWGKAGIAAVVMLALFALEGVFRLLNVGVVREY